MQFELIRVARFAFSAARALAWGEALIRRALRVCFATCIFAIASAVLAQTQPQAASGEQHPVKGRTPESANRQIKYINARYGFSFTLPASWRGYRIVQSTWKSDSPCSYCSSKRIEHGPFVGIRHPRWTAKTPWVDIDIMVLTLAQSKALDEGKFSLSGAAPVGPGELGRNAKYVFFLPVRFGYGQEDRPGYHEAINLALGQGSLQPLRRYPKSQGAEITYTNTLYGFTFTLPASWKGYTIVERGCAAGNAADCVPEILIRYPRWTAENPWEDIPIMILTRAQWRAVEKGDLSVSAAPFPPGELGRNRKYVFALPPRWDYDLAEGWKAAGDILGHNPLHPF
jgi:hypothetical protein